MASTEEGTVKAADGTELYTKTWKVSCDLTVSTISY